MPPTAANRHDPRPSSRGHDRADPVAPQDGEAGDGRHDAQRQVGLPPPDGGFFFSPSEHDGNKAGPLDPAAPAGPFRSYGSATADGFRGLTRLGLPPDHPRVAAAAGWLERRFRADANPGDFTAVNEVRRASSYYYWAWSAAHALRALGKPVLAFPNNELGDQPFQIDALHAQGMLLKADQSQSQNEITAMMNQLLGFRPQRAIDVKGAERSVEIVRQLLDA